MTAPVIDAPAPDPDGIIGSTTPRLWTRPLVTGPAGPCGCGCALTRATSYGFAVIDFARDVLGEPLDPWQAWLVIHAGERLPDGRPRFRRVLVLVARQNGKTHLLKVLALYWLFVEIISLTVGTSTKLEYARDSWADTVKSIRGNPALIGLMPPGRGGQDGDLAQPGGIRETNGQESITTREDATYRIAASGRKGGRSMRIKRLMCDEVREHRDWQAYGAAYNAMRAQPDGQAWFTSNAGDDGSVVLNSLQKSADGGRDRRLGRFEWSAEEDCDVEDPHAWAAANPNLGRRIEPDSIAGDAATAAANGGDEEATFRTESLCQRVSKLNAAVGPKGWLGGVTDGDLSAYRGRVALCLDVAPDGLHATLTAAAVIRPGVTWVEVADAWSGPGCTRELRRDLPALIAKIRPRALGWFPSGPAAVLTADLGKVKRPGWPPRGVTVEEIRAEVCAVCMGFAEQVRAGAVTHPADALLDDHVLHAERLGVGRMWRFVRADGHCDAVYAAAGAVHLARTLPVRPASSGKVPASTAVRDELARRRNAARRPGQ